VAWGTPVQSFVFLGLFVFELEPTYATSDRQTTDADHRLMPPTRGHNNIRPITHTAKLLIILSYHLSSFSLSKLQDMEIIALARVQLLSNRKYQEELEAVVVASTLDYM